MEIRLKKSAASTAENLNRIPSHLPFLYLLMLNYHAVDYLNIKEVQTLRPHFQSPNREATLCVKKKNLVIQRETRHGLS